MKRIIVLIILSIFASCSTNKIDSGLYKKSTNYKNLLANQIPSLWKRIYSRDTDFVLQNKISNSTFFFNSACRKFENSNLSQLSSSLLSSVDRYEILDSQQFLHHDRDSQLLKIKATVDGVERFLYTLTTLKNNCIYDYTLIALRLNTLESELDDFINFSNLIIIN